MTTLLFGLHPQRAVLMSVMKTRKELCVREMIVTARAVSFVQACTLFRLHSLSLYLSISVSPPLFLLVKLMVYVMEGIECGFQGLCFAFFCDSHMIVFLGDFLFWGHGN
jgi:hypothetical protein